MQNSDVYTVSRLNNSVRFLLEDTYENVWVEGEISNFAAPNSGHWYFSLKDASAQVRCALFRGNQRQLGFTPKDGMHVLIKARVSLYENRGEFQLIAEFMEERGEGKLRRAYELLKQKLEAAGLFAEEHKKPLPFFPKQIGVITSATGAALQDILTVLKRRCAVIPIIIYPTLVQGATAAPTIINAIQLANQRNECDVLILARGGGSLEDLWPFNEEALAHAIYKSVIPIVSGIGHEVDFTIADFVADKRAPTPSVAAEIITPDKSDLLQTLKSAERQFYRLILHVVNNAKQQLQWLQKHLTQLHPKRKLIEKMQGLDFAEQTLIQLMQKKLASTQYQLADSIHLLQRHAPLKQIHDAEHQLNFYLQKLNNSIMRELNKKQTLLANVAAKLDGLSPLATLQRGYAIVITETKKIVRKAHEIKVGSKVHVQLAEGELDCQVIGVK
jgi:exodeoxyribonuclease VII large subunit